MEIDIFLKLYGENECRFNSTVGGSFLYQDSYVSDNNINVISIKLKRVDDYVVMDSTETIEDLVNLVYIYGGYVKINGVEILTLP